MNEARTYPLGYFEDEARRLASQGAFLEDLTADVLRRAGIDRAWWCWTWAAA